MTPIKFPQCNIVFRPPPDLEESQCMSIPAHLHEIQGGSCDGLKQVVVAYELSSEEREAIANGNPLFISMIGGLAPHYPSLSFEAATHPS